jgi:hypothetical protein
VFGTTTNTAQGGVFGEDRCPTGANGVLGNSDKGNGVFGTSLTGTGIKGQSQDGPGVGGSSTNGTGVTGDSFDGVGVGGSSPTGIGVKASSPSGTALAVAGTARFSRSGIASVPLGQTSVTVTLDNVAPTSLVIATLQANQISGLHGGPPITLVCAVAGAGSFTITVSSAPHIQALPVAWIVFDPALS